MGCCMFVFAFSFLFLLLLLLVFFGGGGGFFFFLLNSHYYLPRTTRGGEGGGKRERNIGRLIYGRPGVGGVLGFYGLGKCDEYMGGGEGI